jgi:probable rRNA maturation factor
MSSAEPVVTLTERATLEGLDEVRVHALLSRAWSLYGGRDGAAVEIVLMGEDEHTKLHDRFLDDPTSTDVMAFPYDEPDLFGEVLVNLDMARVQAEARGISTLEEAELYVVHGALHLLGLDDRDDASRVEMRAAEREVLQRN